MSAIKIVNKFFHEVKSVTDSKENMTIEVTPQGCCFKIRTGPQRVRHGRGLQACV